MSPRNGSSSAASRRSINSACAGLILPPRVVQRKPLRLIDFRKARALAALWRPFDLERIAFEVVAVEVAFERKRGHGFAGLLTDLTERRHLPAGNGPSSSANSRLAAASGSSSSSYSPLGMTTRRHPCSSRTGRRDAPRARASNRARASTKECRRCSCHVCLKCFRKTARAVLSQVTSAALLHSGFPLAMVSLEPGRGPFGRTSWRKSWNFARTDPLISLAHARRSNARNAVSNFRPRMV